MGEAGRILLFGASTRAAAFSALRAGLRPWCIDLFADRDLQARCPVQSVQGKYPDSFRDILRAAPSGPWMYTGGLENHPRLVGEMSHIRKLWGNDAAALERVRNPWFVANTVRSAGLSAPAVYEPAENLHDKPLDPKRRWLVKPLRGAAGRDIAFWMGEQPSSSRAKSYYQEFMEGDSVAALYVGDGRSARLLGVTGQLIGASFCHATAFQYCGSVGPLAIGVGLQCNLERLGTALTAACHLRGLFGVDGVLRGEVFWPVEVNPRYTASVEVLEYATGLQALAWHQAVFEPETPSPALVERPPVAVGKAILMAREDVVFPADGPWEGVLKTRTALDEMPTFADIPQASERIKTGRPILTLFASGGKLADCEDELRRRAVDLDHYLFGS